MSRAYCYQCFRVEKNCLCNKLSIIDNKINIIVLQHPDEIKNVKGSSIIAKLYLQNYRSWQGEDFSHNNELIELIEKHKESTLIVFPGDDGLQLVDWVKGINNQSQLLEMNYYNLIFIDASWRKARKIWLSFPLFKEIKCVHLGSSGMSNYRIRKIPMPGYLSTIEAIVTCLSVAENNSEKYLPLLRVFDNMIDAQISYIDKKVFNEHYKNK